jgi:outer membrane immunogenic protein
VTAAPTDHRYKAGIIRGLAMKKLMLATAACAGLGALSCASAADLLPRSYTKSLLAPTSAYDWSGFYAGANGGWGSSRNCWDVRIPATGVTASEGCHDADGGVAGGQLGFNLQAGAFVFGAEVQTDWADLRGSNVSAQFVGTTNRSRIDSFGLITGRIGYAWNNALLYVKGGGAFTHDRYDYRPTGAASPLGTTSETRWGGAAGVGLEYGFAPSWSVAVEYDHLFMGRGDVRFVTSVIPLESIQQDADIVTARINYRWNTPVLGKY